MHPLTALTTCGPARWQTSLADQSAMWPRTYTAAAYPACANQRPGRPLGFLGLCLNMGTRSLTLYYRPLAGSLYVFSPKSQSDREIAPFVPSNSPNWPPAWPDACDPPLGVPPAPGGHMVIRGHLTLAVRLARPEAKPPLPSYSHEPPPARFVTQQSMPRPSPLFGGTLLTGQKVTPQARANRPAGDTLPPRWAIGLFADRLRVIVP